MVIHQHHSEVSRTGFLFGPGKLRFAGLGVVLALAGLTTVRADNYDAPDAAQTRTHWAFQAVPERVDVPATGDGWALNDIDRFIAARLDEAGLSPNPPADPLVLLRRLSFGVTGLPPAPEQVKRFADGIDGEAYRKLIDELLAQPEYGERWGRHWLDVARYADTTGDGADAPIPEARYYRDYVIQAFNDDLPYNDFIREQIAGDLMVADHGDERARERLIATGYVALSRRFNNGEYRDMHLVIDNTLGTIGRGMLGLTLDCARCHDHRDDPITMNDYYGLFGYFSSTQYPHGSTESGRVRKNFVDLPGGGQAYSVADMRDPKKIGDAPILELGEPGQHGPKAGRAFIAALADATPDIPEGQSGRLQLAEWIASDDNPLTARVMVNRIWQYHFGRGLVATSSNLGRGGDLPTHPELLDWLTREFIDNGWSVKHVHRLILQSATWRMSSSTQAAALETDPGNRLLWKYPRRRLEAEPMRDAVLAISGLLKPGAPEGSPLPKPNDKNEYNYTQHNPFSEDFESDHRTVYQPSRRLGRPAFMQTFNGPDPNECTEVRTVSTVPSQALFWLNSGFIERNADAMAERLLLEVDNDDERLGQAFLLSYGRPPADEERAAMLAHLQGVREALPGDQQDADGRRAWKSLCRVLLASNEFIYLD